jgi:hypothetical protein
MDLIFTLQAGNIIAPKNWQDIKLKMTFNDNNQPQIEADEITFVNEQVAVIQNQLDTAGIYSGLDFNIGLVNSTQQLYLGGYLDLTTLRWDSPVQCKAKFLQSDSLQLLDDKFRGCSFAYLQSLGKITPSDYIDVPVIIQKKFDGTEVAVSSFILFMITKTILEINAKDAPESVLKLSKIAISGINTPAEVLEFVGRLIYIIAYYALMAIAIINLLKSLRENFIPRLTKYRGIRLKTALERACTHFGYVLDCDIEDIYNIVYLPAKNNPKVKPNANDEGIPNPQDFGYNVAELFQLVFDLTDSKFTIKGKTLYIRNQYSEFWKGTSSNILPSHIATEAFSYNANDLFANTLLHFQYDSSEEHTLPSINKHADDYSRGTNFEAIVDFDNGGDQLGKMNKGLKEISIPMALGMRRTRLSATEEVLKNLLSSVDILIKLLGGGTPLTDAINLSKGALLISQNSFNVAKLVYLDKTGFIPPYHRDYLSATAMWRNYYVNTSFVYNGKENQRLMFKDVKIPMDFERFMAYKDSPYFQLEADSSPFSGNTGKILNLSWNIASDSAVADFYIEKQYIGNQILTSKEIES